VKWRKENMKKEDKLISIWHAPFDMRALNLFSKLVRRFYLRLGSRELKHAETLSKKDGKYVYNWRKYPIPVAHNARFRMIAKHFARKLQYSDTYLIVPQPLLLWLYLEGELAGREYDVLMSAMPMPEIKRQLDEAMKRYGFQIESGYYEATNELNPCLDWKQADNAEELERLLTEVFTMANNTVTR